MKKNILKSTFVVATLIMTCYAGTETYLRTRTEASDMSGILLQNVEALAQGTDDDLNKPKPEYVMVEKASGYCCIIVPTGNPNQPNEKIKTNNLWRTCKREEKNEQNKNSSCTTQYCPDGETQYCEP